MQHCDELHIFVVDFCDALAAPFNPHANTIRLIVNTARERSIRAIRSQDVPPNER